MMRVVLCGAAAFCLASAADAAALLTTDAGYSGPALAIDAGMTDYVLTSGPARLPGGITFTSNYDESGYGVVDAGGYTLTDNGYVDGALVFANQPYPIGSLATVTLTFDTPVASFGAFMNYGAAYDSGFQIFYDGIHPTISAYGVNGALIATYDLATLAPIFSQGSADFFAFRGIDGEGTLIKSFSFGGAAIVARAETAGPAEAVPEPASWMMMLAGFGAIGLAVRGSRSKLALPYTA